MGLIPLLSYFFMSLYYSKQMNRTSPRFAVLSTQQEKAKDRAKLLKREGHKMDLLKHRNPWRTLNNYST